MKRTFISLVIVIAIFFGGLAFAEEMTGEVIAVNSNLNNFVVKTGEGNVVCKVNNETKIISGNESKTLSGLRVGDKVKCNYVTRHTGRTHLCKELNITASAK